MISNVYQKKDNQKTISREEYLELLYKTMFSEVTEGQTVL